MKRAAGNVLTYFASSCPIFDETWLQIEVGENETWLQIEEVSGTAMGLCGLVA